MESKKVLAQANYTSIMLVNMEIDKFLKNNYKVQNIIDIL